MSALATIRMIFGKAHVRQHQRTSSTGHLETVREHERNQEVGEHEHNYLDYTPNNRFCRTCGQRDETYHEKNKPQDDKSSINIQAFMRNYRRNESQNRHTLNILRLAEAFGDDEQIALAQRGMKHLKEHGGQDYELSKELYEKIHVPLWPKAQGMAQEQGLHPRLAKAVAEVEIFVKSRLVEQWTPDASLIFNKARVRQHARTSSTGKVENVREHERATPPHQPPPMDTFTATMIAEGMDEADEETQLRAWQHLIDTGVVWQLQGWFGRRASELIESGICHRAGGPVQKALTLTFGKSVVKQHPRKEKSGKVSTVKQYSDSRTKKPVGGAEARDTSHGQKPKGVEISGIQSVDFHRNGVTGEGFHVVKFQYLMPGEEEEHPMVGIVFDQAHHVAVFDMEKLSQGDTSFGSNSWRGDQFEPLLRRAIEQQEKDLQGKREQGAQQRSKRDEDAEKVKKYDATEKKVSAIDQNHAIAKQLASAGYGMEEAKAIAHVIETGGMAGTDKDIQDFAQDLQKHGLKSKQADDIAKKYYSKKEPESGKRTAGEESKRSRDDHYI